MPIYDYRCDHCGHAFSAVQAMIDEPLDRCPKCGARPRRVPSRPAIVFKGSGWYATDHRKKSWGGEKSEKDKGEKTEPKPSTGAESGKRGGAKADDAAAAK